MHQLPVEFAQGLPAPKHVKRPNRIVKQTEKASAEEEVGGEVQVVVDGSNAAPTEPQPEPTEEEEKQEPLHQEETPEERVLRLAARRLRWSQNYGVLGWALFFGVLRVADLSLSLAGTWGWKDALWALAGVVVGLMLAVIVLHTAVRHWRGKLPRLVACALPGVHLILGAGILALVSGIGLISVGESGNWNGVTDLAIDEVARFVNVKECSRPVCFHFVAFVASLAQTLLVVGASVTLVLIASLCASRRCLKFSNSKRYGVVIGFSLFATLVLSLVRGSYVAWDAGESSKVWPEWRFTFTVMVYMVTQAMARFGAPVCLLLRLGSMWGVKVLLPAVCRSRRNAAASRAPTKPTPSSSAEPKQDVLQQEDQQI